MLVFFQSAVPDPHSVTIISSHGNIIVNGSDITLNCSIQMYSSVMDSEVSLLYNGGCTAYQA